MKLVGMTDVLPDASVLPLRSCEWERARTLRYEPRRTTAPGHYRLEVRFPPEGLVDMLVELELTGGRRHFARLSVTERNHFDGCIEIEGELICLRLHVSGSGRTDRPIALSLNPWPLNQPALTRHAKRLFNDLRKAPAAFPGKLARMALRRLRARPSNDAVTQWRTLFDERPELHRSLHADRLARLKTQPVFHVLLPSHGDVSTVRHLIENLREQIYPRWQLLVCNFAGMPDDWASVTAMDPRVRLAAEQKQALGLLEPAHDDLLCVAVPDMGLRPNAFLECAIAREKFPDAKVFYADHGIVSAEGDSETPVFKPAWSPETFAHRNYLGDPVWYTVDAAVRWLDDDPDCAKLHLHIGGASHQEIIHIPRILALRGPDESGVATNWRLMAPKADVPDPLVTIIIPTRDRAALLQSCLDSITAHTRYPNFEIIIVDNESVMDETHRLLEKLSARPEIRILRQPGPFNYSELNNAAAAIARGSVLALLNNDVEVLSEEWLGRMVDLAIRQEIGCVGAMLLYPNGTIQHAGLALGIGGGAAHLFRGFRPDDPAIASYLDFPRNVTAVTGACLVLRKSLFDQVGGLDADSLAVSNNDVDLCLKVSALGYRNIWAPEAVLTHHESISRGKDDTPEKLRLARYELAVMHKRWGKRMMSDSYYSPNLTAWADDMSIRDR